MSELAADVNMVESMSVPAPASPQPWPAPRVARYSLFVMAIATMFTVLDRQVLTLMIEPIKKDFGISDTQAALLMGAAFSLTYGIAGLPLSRLADSSNRRNLMAGCIAFWSGATIACGLAQNYVQIFVARLGVGVGEAGYSPATWSVINDTFPREKIGFANSVAGVGLQTGNGLALLLGGVSLAIVAQFPTLELPLVGPIRSWQWAFIIVGIPGLLWALVMLTLHEPARRGVAANEVFTGASLKEVLRYMWGDFRTYTGIMGGACLKYLLALGTTQWVPTLLYREFKWELSDVGLYMGIIALVVGPVGLLIGGKLSERWCRNGMADANLRLMFYTLIIATPISIIYPLIPNPYLLLGFFALNSFVALIAAGPSVAAFQVITPSRMRAQVGAISMFTVNVVAFALGPLIVALFTDYLFRGPENLKYSMSLCAAILGPLGCLVMAQGLKPYARSYVRTAE